MHRKSDTRSKGTAMPFTNLIGPMKRMLTWVLAGSTGIIVPFLLSRQHHKVGLNLPPLVEVWATFVRTLHQPGETALKVIWMRKHNPSTVADHTLIQVGDFAFPGFTHRISLSVSRVLALASGVSPCGDRFRISLTVHQRRTIVSGGGRCCTIA